jgi:hypothetical protein
LHRVDERLERKNGIGRQIRHSLLTPFQRAA